MSRPKRNKINYSGQYLYYYTLLAGNKTKETVRAVTSARFLIAIRYNNNVRLVSYSLTSPSGIVMISRVAFVVDIIYFIIIFSDRTRKICER